LRPGNPRGWGPDGPFCWDVPPNSPQTCVGAHFRALFQGSGPPHCGLFWIEIRSHCPLPRGGPSLQTNLGKKGEGTVPGSKPLSILRSSGGQDLGRAWGLSIFFVPKISNPIPPRQPPRPGSSGGPKKGLPVPAWAPISGGGLSRKKKGTPPPRFPRPSKGARGGLMGRWSGISAPMGGPRVEAEPQAGWSEKRGAGAADRGQLDPIGSRLGHITGRGKFPPPQKAEPGTGARGPPGPTGPPRRPPGAAGLPALNSKPGPSRPRAFGRGFRFKAAKGAGGPRKIRRGHFERPLTGAGKAGPKALFKGWGLPHRAQSACLLPALVCQGLGGPQRMFWGGGKPGLVALLRGKGIFPEAFGPRGAKPQPGGNGGRGADPRICGQGAERA